jgi:hypothetical protein
MDDYQWINCVREDFEIIFKDGLFRMGMAVRYNYWISSRGM